MFLEVAAAFYFLVPAVLLWNVGTRNNKRGPPDPALAANRQAVRSRT